MLKKIINEDQAKPDPKQESPAPASASTASTSGKANPTHKETSMSSSKNILSNDVEITGNLKFSNDLIIDGRIEGEVTSDGNLTVGENATMKGEIKTKSVTVFGKVEGNITVTERAELKSQAELLGDIRAGTLSIEEGATFMGSSTVGKAAHSRPPASSGPSSGGGGMPQGASHDPSKKPAPAG